MERVEGAAADRFTQVLATKRGRPVRADFHVADVREPWMIAWAQELAGTPFARVLRESVIQVDLEPGATPDAGTTVTMTHEQKPRGYSRTGGRMIRRATEDRLERALAGLAAMV